MKIFLVVYDRIRGELVEIEECDFYDRALEARLRLEIEQRHRLQGREIVLLEAASLETLHRTHSRYFKSARQLLEQAEVATA